MPTLFLLNTLMMGGSAKKTIRIANALSKRGHTIHLGYLNKPETLLSEIGAGISVLFLDRKNKFDFGALFRLRDYVVSHNVKNILCLNLYPSLYGFLCKTSIAGTKPNCMTFVNITDFPSLKGKLQMIAYWLPLKSSERIIFGCESQRSQWTSRYFLPVQKTSVIYNGVDCERFSPDAIPNPPSRLREKYSIPQEDIIIACVAELRPEKGHRDLINAFAALAKRGFPVRLVLAGDGPERAALGHLTETLSVKARVHFLGRIEDVRPVLSITDIFTLASTSVETFSNAALEAMAMGKPILLSDIGGAREMVRSGENGYLFRPRDVGDLERQLATMIEDTATRRAMGQKAFKTAREYFHFDTMLGHYEQLILPHSDHPRGKAYGQSIHHLSS